MVEPAMPRTGSVMGLAHGHADVEEELVVAGDELQHRGQGTGVVGGARQGGGNLAQEKAGAGDVALVHLVAHGQAAGDDSLEGQTTSDGQRLGQRRAQGIGQPAQAVQHLGVVAAEAHDLAQPLVESAVSAVSERPVLDHHHRHAPGGDAGHRADRVEVVVGVEGDAAGRGQAHRGFQVGGPALEDGGPGDGALQRAAHALPVNGRAGVQHHAVLEAGDRVCGGKHVDEHGLGGEHPFQGLLVGFFDLLPHGVPCPVRIPAWPGGRGCGRSPPAATSRGGWWARRVRRAHGRSSPGRC